MDDESLSPILPCKCGDMPVWDAGLIDYGWDEGMVGNQLLCLRCGTKTLLRSTHKEAVDDWNFKQGKPHGS